VFRRLRGPGWNYPITCFASSSTNLVRGLVYRVLSYKGGPIIAPKPGSWSRLTVQIIRGLRKHGMRPTTLMTTESWLGRYQGRKLSVYRKALESLNVKALGDRDFVVKAFIKRDKDKIPMNGGPSPDPRIIQPRSPRVVVSLGPYICSIEKPLYKSFASLWKSIAMSTATPVCFKGFNYHDRGLLMKAKWGAFQDPVAVALDASRFDLHVSSDALTFTDQLYMRCFHRSELPALEYILSRRHRTVGVAGCRESWWRYTKEGGRCSGDSDTSLGNVCIMLAVSYRIADILRIHIELANDGDDQIFFVERSDLDALLDVIEPTFEEFGLRVKVETPVRILERVDFCQTRPVLDASGSYKMVRYPTLSLTKDLSSFLSIDKETVARNMCNAIGKCGWSAYWDMPIFKEFYWKLMNVGGDGTQHWKQTGVDLGFLYHVKDLSADPQLYRACINPEVRVSFWRAFGILPDEQLALEEEIRGWKVQFGPPARVDRPSFWWWAARDHTDPSLLEGH